ncbi:MAG: membrane protein insertion efficiency factor YidD [Flavobacteriales bacterium]
MACFRLLWILLFFGFLTMGGIPMGNAQSKKAIETMKGLFPKGNDKRKQYRIDSTAGNPLELFYSASFVAYKHYISSQDGGNCSFTPSCSVYFVRAIKEQGPIIGYMNGLDRLSRCNGFHTDLYERHPSDLLLKDPLHNDPFISTEKP